MTNNLSLPGYTSDIEISKTLYNNTMNNSYNKVENRLIPLNGREVHECICSGGGGEACLSWCGCSCTSSGCRTHDCQVQPQ